MRFIGSKNLLLEYIDEMLSKHIDGSEEVFIDLFGGTNTVGRYFKNRYTVISNDILYFSYLNSKATISCKGDLKFSKLKELGIEDPIKYLQEKANTLDNSKNNYYEMAYSPSGGSMYFSIENAKRIDIIREEIENWHINEQIDDDEYYYLLTVLIEAIPFISNITGTYGAYLKKWDKRSMNDLTLEPIEIVNNNKKNVSYNKDSNEIVKDIKGDIVYIDTPYNSRQYASNYHVLENIARNNKPELKGKTKIFDWSKLKSKYSSKVTAAKAMNDLIKNIDAEHIILSYNDEGIIPIDELIKIMEDNSIDKKVDIKYIDYRKYKSKKVSSKKDVKEVLIYIRKKEKNKRKPKKNKEIKKCNSWKLDTKSYIKSPLNYVGGKFKLLPQLIPLFPKDIDTFVDLFSGGANVGINVDAKKYIFNDMNYRINEMFRLFAKSNSDDLIEVIKDKIYKNKLTKFNEDAYKLFRDKYNKNQNPLDLYILISFSYNYQIRFNNSMEFNNPFGRNRSQFSINMEKNLRNFIDKVSEIDAEFTDFYFEEFDYSMLNEQDFVYLDPPYLITTASYNDGNRGFQNWGKEQELKMYDVLKNLIDRNIKWALSNVLEHKGKENELLKEFVIENGLNVHELSYDYRNSSHNTKRDTSKEVLITNY